MKTLGHVYDNNLLLKDAGLVAADAAAQVSSAAKIIDVGANEVQGDVVIDISAIEIATGDEQYEIVLQGSSSSSFASGVACLCSLRVGDGSTIAAALGTGGAVDVDDTTGRFILPFRNERNGTVYRYLRLYTVVTGTIATGINYTAYLAPKVI